MSASEREALAQKIEERSTFWIKVLNLEHWRIDVEIHTELSDPEALASCSASEYYDSATIKIAEDWEANAGEDQTLDYIIVHELLHIHMRDVHETFQDAVGKLGSLGDSYRRSWTRAEEAFVDRLAYAFVDRLPYALLENVVTSGADDS